jgi:hypothetical protein
VDGRSCACYNRGRWPSSAVNPWNAFTHVHAGMGLSMQLLSGMHRASHGSGLNGLSAGLCLGGGGGGGGGSGGMASERTVLSSSLLVAVAIVDPGLP